MVKTSHPGEEQVTVVTPMDASLRPWSRSGDLPLALDSALVMEHGDTGITKFTEFYGKFPFTQCFGRTFKESTRYHRDTHKAPEETKHYHYHSGTFFYVIPV